MLLSKKNMLGFITITLMMCLSSTFANTNHLLTEENVINVVGGNVWYKIVSSQKTKHKIPLLILHGGPGVPHNYLNTFKHLANDRPVILYDQLGCGRSPVSKPDATLWNINRFETELETLVNHLHLKKFHLLGHSWGGALATEYALKHPERLQSLTLVSPLLSTSRWIDDSKQLISQLPPDTQQTISMNEQQGTTDSKEYLNAMDMYYHLFVCRMKEWPSDLVYSLEHLNPEVYKTMWGPSEFSMTGNLKHFDRMDSLHQLNMPVLITGGKYDEARPDTLAYAVKQLPHGQLIIYENSAHMAFLEEQKKYLSDLRLFLKKEDQ